MLLLLLFLLVFSVSSTWKSQQLKPVPTSHGFLCFNCGIENNLFAKWIQHVHTVHTGFVTCSSKYMFNLMNRKIYGNSKVYLRWSTVQTMPFEGPLGFWSRRTFCFETERDVSSILRAIYCSVYLVSVLFTAPLLVWVSPVTCCCSQCCSSPDPPDWGLPWTCSISASVLGPATLDLRGARDDWGVRGKLDIHSAACAAVHSWATEITFEHAPCRVSSHAPPTFGRMNSEIKMFVVAERFVWDLSA